MCSGRGAPPLLRDQAFDVRHEGGGVCHERRLTRPEHSHFTFHDEEPAAGERPGPVEDPWPEERVRRHTVDQTVETCVPVQILDDPVPQMVDQLVEVFELLDNVVPEQVIDVPKISQGRIPQRSVDRDPQRVEQLVEVPTVVSSSCIQLHSLEQTVYIPVHGGVKRARRGLPGSVPGQSTMAFSGAAAASQKTLAEESVAKVAGNSEAVSVAAKTVASQKTEVGYAAISGAAVSRGVHGSVPRQSSTAIVALNIVITAVFSQDSAHQRFAEQNTMITKALS